MRIKPLHERRGNKPVAFILGVRADGTLLLRTNAVERWLSLDELRDYWRYAIYLFCRPMQVIEATDARQWTGYSWSGNLNRLVLDDGPTLYPWHSVVRGMSPEDAVNESAILLAWLSDKAVIPGSLSSMTWRLWRATLDTDLELTSLPAYQKIGTEALYGGRQEAPYPGDYRTCWHYDIASAYPTSMASGEYATDFVDNGRTIGDGVGIARATVIVPRTEWTPLPVRIHEHILCYGYGKARGYWTWNELRTARDSGCDITVHQSWQGVEYADLFGEWWPVLLEGRRRTQLAKAITSRLWGAFALSQTGGKVIRWLDAEGKCPAKQSIPGRSVPVAPYIAAETTSRVRTRLWREAIVGCPDLLYVDTDGIITGSVLPPDKIGPLPGQWRVKDTMVRCEIRAPQVLRHECPTCNRDHAKWHYCVSGATSKENAADIFARTARHPGDGYAVISPNTITLPRQRLEKAYDLSAVNVRVRRRI